MPVPPDISAYVASKPFGVAITVHATSRYSMTELDAALDRLIASPLLTQLDAKRLGVNDDGSGIDVGIQGADPPGATVIAQLRDVSGIDDITVSTGVKPAITYGSRQADTSPWRGGARIYTPTGTCTSGFAVLVGSAGRLLSARHCVVDASNTVVNGPIRSGGGTQISPTGGFVVNYTIDSMLIDPSASPATVPRIYRGAYNSSTYSTVRNWYTNNYNDFVCNSGATTGEHCGYIYDDNDVVEITPNVWIRVVQVAAPSGSIFAGEGDSGGPVFKPLSNGAQARGIILGPDLEAGPTTTSCGATAIPGIICSRWVNYVPIGLILNTWGVQLEVG